MPRDPTIVEIPYETGQIWCRYTQVPALDGSGWIRHGPYREYDRNGQLISEGAYKNGKEEGLWRVWQPDGRLVAEGYYINGIGFGWRHWDSNGNIWG
jgi:antitoxin component YwqK of YwqJK toxin-antitoxin module